MALALLMATFASMMARVLLSKLDPDISTASCHQAIHSLATSEALDLSFHIQAADRMYFEFLEEELYSASSKEPFRYCCLDLVSWSAHPTDSSAICYLFDCLVALILFHHF